MFPFVLPPLEPVWLQAPLILDVTSTELWSSSDSFEELVLTLPGKNNSYGSLVQSLPLSSTSCATELTFNPSCLMALESLNQETQVIISNPQHRLRLGENREHSVWETTPEPLDTHNEITANSMVTPDIPHSPPPQPTLSISQPAEVSEMPPNLVGEGVTPAPENFSPESSDAPVAESSSLGEPMSVGYPSSVSPSSSSRSLSAPPTPSSPKVEFGDHPPIDALANQKAASSTDEKIQLNWFQEESSESVWSIHGGPIHRIITQERDGDSREFNLEQRPEDEDALEDNALENREGTLEDDEDSLEDAEDSLEDDEDSLEDAEDSLEDDEDSLEDAEDSLEDEEDVLEDAEDSLEDEEDILEDAEDSLEDEEGILEDAEDTLEDEEDVLEDAEDTLEDDGILEEEEIPESLAPPSPSTPDPSGIIEIKADRQEYNQQQRVVTAQGDVVVRFARGVLTADRVQINLPNRFLWAVGNVALRRGDQTIRGEEFEYQLVQDEGIVHQASGEIYQPTTGRDLDFTQTGIAATDITPSRPLSDRLLQQQPVRNISPASGYQFSVGSIRQVEGLTSVPTTGTSGDVKRFRFEADYIEFDSEGWWARNIRLTNDPFSPPELEIRADTAEFNRLNEFQDEILTTNSRITFDQGLSLPIFQDRILIDRRPDQAGLFNIGFDDDERGGFFIERKFTILQTPNVAWTVTPQYYVQRALFDESAFDPSVFGLKTGLNVIFSERTRLIGSAEVTSMRLEDFEDNFRSSVRLRHLIGSLDRPHTLTAEYSFRDRLFNGSLGFQTVQTSFGAVLTSPNIVLGDTGINLRYQGGIQIVTANTDRSDLLPDERENNRITLTRYQGVASLSRNFTLWEGEGLPPTPTEGLRYTNQPVVPYLRLNAKVTGLASLYSSNDTQEALTGSIGLSGQIGHFSRPFLDYTGFNISYSQSAVGELSPFLFDRIADRRRLSFGVTQQIYGPFRFGFQSSINLETNEEISTNYILEYSRRTYNVQLRYNPVVGLGSFLIRIGDFNWLGTGEPFGGSGVRPVVQGVTQ